MASLQKITPCLWFNANAEEAVNYYCDVFENSRILAVTHYPKEGLADFQKDFAGKVLTISFELAGQQFLALNAGPEFTFNESISMMIDCENQEEIDYFWRKLSFVPGAEQCGWCKDQFGLSWQVTPEQTMAELDANQFAALMEMKKIDIATLEAAATTPER